MFHIYVSLFFVLFPRFHAVNIKDIIISVDTEESYFLKDETGNLFLQVTDSQSFQLTFKNDTKWAEAPVDCILKTSINEVGGLVVTGEKFGDSSTIHFIMRTRMNGYAICRSRLYNDSRFSFYVFASPKNANFFVSNTIEIMNNNGDDIYVSCKGGYYYKNVSLLIDGKNTTIKYDPMRGFHLKNFDVSRCHVFECLKNDEVSTTVYGPEHVDEQYEYEIFYEYDNNHHVVHCTMKGSNDTIIKNLDSINVYVSCVNRTICSKISHQIRKPSKLQATLFLPINIVIESNFTCVFIAQNGNIVTRTIYIELPKKISSWIFLVIPIVSTIFFLLNKTCRNRKLTHYQLLEPTVCKDELGIEEKNLIGLGNSSKIYKCQWPEEPNKLVAVKCRVRKNSKSLHEEAKIISQLRHPNIVSIIAVSKQTHKIFSMESDNINCLIMPYYERKSLDKYLKIFSPKNYKYSNNISIYSEDGSMSISVFDLVSFSWQIARALVYLKSKMCTHRDLALRNCLLSDDGIVKLSDFERSKFKETKKRSKLKRTIWMIWMNVIGRSIPFKSYPLEALEGDYQFSADVWSFGILVAEIFSLGQETFPRGMNFEKYKEYLKSMKSIRKPELCPTEIYDDIITKCVCNSRVKRPQIENSETILRRYLEKLSYEKFEKLNSKLTNDIEIESHLEVDNRFVVNGKLYSKPNMELNFLV